MAERVRLKGYPRKPVVPSGAFFVARPSKWGNPHRIGACVTCDGAEHTRDEAVALFREDLLAGRLRVSIPDVRESLTGRDLACWCPPDELCHGDVLLELAAEQWS